MRTEKFTFTPALVIQKSRNRYLGHLIGTEVRLEPYDDLESTWTLTPVAQDFLFNPMTFCISQLLSTTYTTPQCLKLSMVE